MQNIYDFKVKIIELKETTLKTYKYILGLTNTSFSLFFKSTIYYI